MWDALVLLMAVAFLPFATSVLAGALDSRHSQRTAVVFYGWPRATLHTRRHRV
jgi:uncharacterized membrane protein